MRRTAPDRARALTRARLMESGRALFAERGLHGLTTHDVAARAGVAAGTFYNHFRDKADLLREIIAEAVDELDRRLDAVRVDERAPRDGVRAHAEALVGFAEDHREQIRIVFSRDADAASVEADVLERLARSIAEDRAQSIARGEMPAEMVPTILAQALVGMWARVIAWWAEDPQRASRDEVIDTLARIQLNGTHPLQSAEPPTGASDRD